jgi:flagellin
LIPIQAARRNANDALGVLEIASGALGGTNNIYKRMRELAVQGSSETLAEDERQYVETEFRALSEELTRLRDVTEFNGIKFMDGSRSTIASTSSASTGSTVLKAGK